LRGHDVAVWISVFCGRARQLEEGGKYGQRNERTNEGGQAFEWRQGLLVAAPAVFKVLGNVQRTAKLWPKLRQLFDDARCHQLLGLRAERLGHLVLDVHFPLQRHMAKVAVHCRVFLFYFSKADQARAMSANAHGTQQLVGLAEAVVVLEKVDVSTSLFDAFVAHR